MNFITRMELIDLSDVELSGLFGRISRELSQAKPGSVEWQGATISLESIRHEQAKRCTVLRPKPPAPGF